MPSDCLKLELFKNQPDRCYGSPLQIVTELPCRAKPCTLPARSLSKQTLLLHYAITSLMEELEAIDWYRQRADDTDDAELKSVLMHNAGEEIEHACMVLEWIRRNEPRFDKELKEYLFTTAPIVQVEKIAEGKDKV